MVWFITLGTTWPIVFLNEADLPTTTLVLVLLAGECRLTPTDFGVAFIFPCEQTPRQPLPFDPPSPCEGVKVNFLGIVDEVVIISLS
jgi:hypothetical protein